MITRNTCISFAVVIMAMNSAFAMPTVKQLGGTSQNATLPAQTNTVARAGSVKTLPTQKPTVTPIKGSVQTNTVSGSYTKDTNISDARRASVKAINIKQYTPSSSVTPGIDKNAVIDILEDYVSRELETYAPREYVDSEIATATQNMATSETITNLQNEVQNKANKSELDTAIAEVNSKIDTAKQEMATSETITNLQNEVQNKANKSELETYAPKEYVDSEIALATQSMATSETITNLQNEVQNKANKSELETAIAGVDSKITTAMQNMATSETITNLQDELQNRISNTASFDIVDNEIVLKDGDTQINVVSLDRIKGEKGNDGRDACTPAYSAAPDANGNTVVTITCKDDDSIILGKYTVLKGVDGAFPCKSLELVEDTSYDGADAKKYKLLCITDEE